MKKKRLFAIFAAFAVAATMVFGFSACEDKNDTVGDNTQKEQPDDEAEKEDTENEGNEKDDAIEADESVLTENQWIKAFKDTVSAKNFNMIVNSEQNITDGGQASTVTYTNEIIVDCENRFTSYNKSTYVEKIGDLVKQESNESYRQVYGAEMIHYFTKYDEGVQSWLYNKSICPSEETAKAVFTEESKFLYNSLLQDIYSGTVDNIFISGDISQLYKLFTYDEHCHTFSAILLSYNSPIIEYVTTISFRNGMLYEITQDVAYGDTDYEFIAHGYLTISYGEVSITVPEEIKNSAKEQEHEHGNSDDNADNQQGQDNNDGSNIFEEINI